MLKIWLGKDNDSIIVSNSDFQHHMMQGLGFKMIVGLNFVAMGKVNPGDYHIYYASKYLSNDPIYRCMRMNDDVDAKYIVLRKDQYHQSKIKQQKKIILMPGDILDIDERDRKYMACASCQRTSRVGRTPSYTHRYTIDTNTTWTCNSVECCIGFYMFGTCSSMPGRLLVFCTNTRLSFCDDTVVKLVADYISGRKEAKTIERIGG